MSGIFFKQLPLRNNVPGTGRIPYYNPIANKDETTTLSNLLSLVQLNNQQVFDLGTITGSTNVYESATPLTSYFTEALYIFKPNADSTADSTLDVNGLGPLDIKEFLGDSLVNKTDLNSLNTYLLLNRTTYWLIIGGSSVVSVNGEIGEVEISLQDVIDVGNTTTNDIQFDSGVGILFDNGARVREGTTNDYSGGNKGVALRCSVDYELKWEAGKLFVMQQDGFSIRESLFNFTILPTITDDDTKGYVVGSRWILDNGDTYTCSDATTGAAVWELTVSGTPTLQQVTGAGAITTNDITVGDILTLYSQILASAIGSVNVTTGTYAYLDASGMLGLHNSVFESNLKNTNVTNSGVVLEFPNKVTGSYDIATTDDIVELQTNSTPNGNQSLLNLVEGNNVTITDDGLGNVTIEASGGILHGTASGTDTYTVTISGPTAYNDGDAYLIRFTNGNTTGATLNINSLGAKTLYKNNDGVLIGGDIISGGEMICVYNSTTDAFQVIGTSPNTLIGYVTNADSVSLTKGMAVYAFGGQGDRMTVKRANNLGDSTSAQTVGLVLSASISAGQKGLIMMQGLLDGLSILPTSTFADGDPIYLGSTAGSITKTKPYAPNHLVYLGVVTTASNGSAGRMYVKVQNGYELDELHNVQAQSPTLKDTLWYDNSVSPAQWKTASIATILGYTPVASNAAITGATKTKITYDSKGLVTAGADIAASDLPSGIDATKIADGSVSNTEFQYLDGVTSAIQTQLNNKLNYYTLFIQSLSINPADGLTYFIGSVPATPNQTANNRLFKFSTAGTLNSFIFSLLQGTNGSAETVTVSIRNNTTTVETQLGTFTSDFGANISTVISFTGLSISVNTTDNYTIKIVSPAWATNPTGWVIGGNLLVTI
jgi:hypothetical protein